MPRILLIGGTSDAARVASELLAEGHEVLHSAFSDEPLPLPVHPRLSRRHGPLDREGFASLVESQGIGRIVDAAHPFAVQVHEEAKAAAQLLGLPYERRLRPEAHYDYDRLHWVSGHQEARVLCVNLGGPWLLTVGSRHAALYAQAARKAGITLHARILDNAQSLEAGLAAGIPKDHLILGRGPFSYEDNLHLLARLGARVLVSKDSGIAGGVPEKIEAARALGCEVVLIRRPIC